MDRYNDKIVFTADDEEPNCGRCDNMDASDDFCTECGKGWWCHYQRTEIEELR